LRPWHYYYSPAAAAAAVRPRYRCWALIDGVLREYTQASIVRLSGAGEYLGVGLHVRSAFTDGGAEKVQ
jgi:hypothetical protein